MTAFLEKLDNAVKKNNSLLCVGLDIDLKKIHVTLLNKEDPIFDFNKAIIDATKEFVCAYKPNIAFYEMYGSYGMQALTKTIEYAGEFVPVILDAKRGDIGNTASAYAKSIFDVFKADATTVNPYMGQDSIQPFIEYKDKGIFVLCLTSNEGAKDFQMAGKDEPLYRTVARRVREWNVNDNLGLVVGATKPAELKAIREIAGNMPILIPGIGAQGGSIPETVRSGVTKKGDRVIMNVSRSVIYASQGEDFPGAARLAARKLKEDINSFRYIKG